MYFVVFIIIIIKLFDYLNFFNHLLCFALVFFFFCRREGENFFIIIQKYQNDNSNLRDKDFFDNIKKENPEEF